MSIISLGFNFYEIILFSGDWEYGIVVGRYETVFMSNENYYHETTINNVVGIIFIGGIFRAILTVITDVMLIVQCIMIDKKKKEGEL